MVKEPSHDTSVLGSDEETFVEASDNQENFEPLLWQTLSSASQKIDCVLNILPESTGQISELMEFLVGSEKNRKLELRIIANITQENLPVAKRLLKYAQLFHLDVTGMGSFYIVDDSAYLYYAEEVDGERGKSHRALVTRDEKFLGMQRFLFENLLSKAVPVRQRLPELERGIHPEFIQTISEPGQILQLSKELVRSSNFEVLVFFSTINSFHRAENDGLLDLLGEASARQVSVKVLVKIDDEGMKDSSKEKIKQRHDRINVAFMEKAPRSRVTTLVVDQTYAMAIEVGDDASDSFSSATGLATYSNSESTVFTYYSMFENLWVQAELEWDSKVRQAYFHMFKGQRMRDEIYKKEWNFEKRPAKGQ